MHDATKRFEIKTLLKVRVAEIRRSLGADRSSGPGCHGGT